MEQILLIIHIAVAFAIIGLVLLQHGKGAEVGAAFGSGASSTLFGSQGSGSFLTRLTATLALCFAITSLSLGYVAAQKGKATGLDKLMQQIEKTAPARTDQAQETPADAVDAVAPALQESRALPEASEVPEAPSAADLPTAVPAEERPEGSD